MDAYSIKSHVQWNINQFTGDTYFQWVRANNRYKHQVKADQEAHYHAIQMSWSILRCINEVPWDTDYLSGFFNEQNRMAKERLHQTL